MVDEYVLKHPLASHGGVVVVLLLGEVVEDTGMGTEKDDQGMSRL